MNVKAAMTEFPRPLLAVMVPNAGGRVPWTAPRHGLSQRLMNLVTFGWEERGEPPAALLLFDTHKDAGKPRAFQVPKPVSAQTCPCKPLMGNG